MKFLNSNRQEHLSRLTCQDCRLKSHLQLEKDFFNDFKILEVPSDNFISGNVIFLPPDKIIVEKSNITAITHIPHIFDQK